MMHNRLLSHRLAVAYVFCVSLWCPAHHQMACLPAAFAKATTCNFKPCPLQPTCYHDRPLPPSSHSVRSPHTTPATTLVSQCPRSTPNRPPCWPADTLAPHPTSHLACPSSKNTSTTSSLPHACRLAPCQRGATASCCEAGQNLAGFNDKAPLPGCECCFHPRCLQLNARQAVKQRTSVTLPARTPVQQETQLNGPAYASSGVLHALMAP